MKLEDTLMLLRAGYSKAEIDAMDSGNNAQHAEDLNLSASDDNIAASLEESAGKEKEQETGADVTSSAQKTAPAQAPAGMEEKVLDHLDRLTKAIQMMNIQNSNIKGGDQEALTGEDVIANIINPPRNNNTKLGGRK